MSRRRSTGAMAGLALVLLGVWGGLIPFVGPYFHYGFRPDSSWHFTWERLYLDGLPASAAVVGGALLAVTARGAMALVGGLLAAAAGAWFAIGVPLSTLWQGAGRFGIGAPLGGHVHQALEWMGFFYGLGAAIAFLAGVAMGRLGMGSRRATPPGEHPPAQVARPAQSAAEDHPEARTADSDEPPAQVAGKTREHSSPGPPTEPDDAREHPRNLPQEW